MKKRNKAKNWIILFAAFSLAVLVLLSGTVYVIDPYFQYRVKDHSYFLTTTYVDAGLIKNYDYDTLIVGSCMIGNFDMDRFRKELNMNPVKIENGGMGAETIAAFLRLAADRGKASKYFVNIDLPSYTAESDIMNEYLMKDDFFSKCKYFLGYETWFRYIPVDAALMLYKSQRGTLPSGKFTQRTSIDCNGSWELDEKFGKETVIKNRLRGLYKVSEIETDNLYNKMVKQIDSFIGTVDFKCGEFNFIFPPYSALYWCDTQDREYFDTFMEAKSYFIKKLLENGCTVYDFQSDDLITDLDNYKDSTHYSPKINEWMTDCFISGKYIVTEENQELFQNKLAEQTKSFRKAHAELFN